MSTKNMNGSWTHTMGTTVARAIPSIFGLALALAGIAGCPPTPPPGPASCTADADCVDSRFCNGEETCSIDSNGDGTCVDGEPPCPAEDCVENADFCPACTDDNAAVNCDDGDECTDDICNDQRECENVNNAAECDDGNDCTSDDACADGACAGTPNTDACDDGDACTENDACGDGVCAGTAVVCDPGDTCNPATGLCEGAGCTSNGDCDDGAFCNGPEVCSGGACAAGSNPCATSGCDEDNDICADECITDADCNDDLFCTGTETCGANGFCVAGTSPCDTDETCQEGDTAAVCLPPAVQSVLFTLAQDNLLGTANSDSFSAALAVSGTGTQVPTLQNGDMANGLAGADALSATYNNNTGVAATLAPTLAGIETLILTDLGGTATTTLSGVNFTGVTSVTSSGSMADLAVNNLNALAALGVTNSDFDLAVTFITPAGNGTTDAVALTLNGSRDTNTTTAQGCTVNITTPVNGIETLNVASAGSTENVLEALTQTTGTSMITLAVSGSTAFTVRRASPLPGTLTTINCGTATAATDLTVGGALNVTYTGGSGNDTINYAGTYASTDVINGGTGTNTLGLNSTQAVAVVAAQTNISNIANILIPDSLNGNVDVTRFGAAPASAATDAILDTTAAATNLTGGASQLTLGTANRTLTLNNDDTAHNLTAVVTGAGLADNLTVNLQNADLAAIFTATGAETVTFNSGNGSDGTAADGGANAAVNVALGGIVGTGTVAITGGVAVTITGTVTAGTITASAAGAAFTLGGVAASATITGSAFNDTLNGSANADTINAGAGTDTINAGADNDVIDAGAGADNITGGGGNDAITPGGDNDRLLYTSTIGTIPANTDGTDQVTDLAVGDSIVLSTTFAYALTGTGVATDQSIDIANDGVITTVRVDLDTDVGEQTTLTISLTVLPVLTNVNFTYTAATGTLARTS